MEVNNIKNTNTRSPIVTILGHVDHGKTTLLDAIRKTNVAKKEAGGITQEIGASVVTTKDGKQITFIDTPGHAAFSQMRSQGASVADIIILVVGADDGIKPQTRESLQLIKEDKVPFIVAITKMDLASASKESVMKQFEKEGIYFEGRGGDIPVVALSAKESKGVNNLVDLIVLVAEVNEIKGDPKAPLEAVVIETAKDRRGMVVSAVVRNGTIKTAQQIFCQEQEVKVRGIFDYKGLRVDQVGPGFPVVILGFEHLPAVGSVISSAIKESLQKRPETTSTAAIIDKGQIPILLKAQNSGSLDAILSSLPKEVVVISSGIGDVFESDVLLAKASGPADIYCFESKASPNIKKLAEAEGVKIFSFDIIYELLDEIDKEVKKTKKVILGKARIVTSFPFNNKKVAGCKMMEGRISKGDSLILQKDEQKLGTVIVKSMRKQKQEVSQVAQGEEFGLIFEPQLDFDDGDMLVSVRK